MHCYRLAPWAIDGRAARVNCVRLFAVVYLVGSAGLPALVRADEARGNVFHDPFIAVTHDLKDCPVPAGPMFTAEQGRTEAHWRAQRGVSCYLSGRCRLSNSYWYDQEIIPRVELAIHADGRFEHTSVWVMGQRRWVWLMGCVASAEQAQTLEALVRNLDDVEAVIDELMVGTTATPAYELAPATR